MKVKIVQKTGKIGENTKRKKEDRIETKNVPDSNNTTFISSSGSVSKKKYQKKCANGKKLKVPRN